MLQVGTVDFLSTSRRAEMPLVSLRTEMWRRHQQATELAGSQTSLEDLPLATSNSSPADRQLQRSAHHPESKRPQASVYNSVDTKDKDAADEMGSGSSGRVGLGSLRSEIPRRPRPNQARAEARTQPERAMACVAVRQRTLQTERTQEGNATMVGLPSVLMPWATAHFTTKKLRKSH